MRDDLRGTTIEGVCRDETLDAPPKERLEPQLALWLGRGFLAIVIGVGAWAWPERDRLLPLHVAAASETAATAPRTVTASLETAQIVQAGAAGAAILHPLPPSASAAPRRSTPVPEGGADATPSPSQPRSRAGAATADGPPQSHAARRRLGSVATAPRRWSDRGAGRRWAQSPRPLTFVARGARRTFSTVRTVIGRLL